MDPLKNLHMCGIYMSPLKWYHANEKSDNPVCVLWSVGAGDVPRRGFQDKLHPAANSFLRSAKSFRVIKLV